MGEAPVWSVIIPAWEAQEAIGRCLRSLVEQRNAPPFEVLVVDSSATDATRRVVEQIRPDLPGLHYHHLDQRAFPATKQRPSAMQRTERQLQHRRSPRRLGVVANPW